jgi:ribosomal protein S18 acetylase RimI-like enzyme
VDVTLRPATDADQDFARRTHHDAFRDVVLRQFGRFGDEQDTFFDNEWNPDTYSIVEIDGEPAGYAQIIDDPEAIKVQMIVLAPAFHNRGAGTRIMNDTIERAKQQDKPVWLGALFENHGARRLYERLGFRETGKTETHFLMEWRNER